MDYIVIAKELTSKNRISKLRVINCSNMKVSEIALDKMKKMISDTDTNIIGIAKDKSLIYRLEKRLFSIYSVPIIGVDSKPINDAEGKKYTYLGNLGVTNKLYRICDYQGNYKDYNYDELIALSKNVYINGIDIKDDRLVEIFSKLRKIEYI